MDRYFRKCENSSSDSQNLPGCQNLGFFGRNFGRFLSSFIYNIISWISMGPDKENEIKRVLATVPPHEIEKLLWNRLDIDSKRNCRLVCKQWEEGVSKTVNFNPVLSYETVEFVKNSTKPVNKLEVLHLKEYEYPEDGFGLKGLDKLIVKSEGSISCVYLEKLLGECTDTKSLELSGRFNRHDSIRRLFNDTLYYFPFFGNPYIVRNDITFNNLAHLKISAEEQLGFMFASALLTITYPNLREIDLSFAGSLKKSINQRVYTDPFHTEIFSFIGRHWKTLKDVRISRVDICNKGDDLEIQLDRIDEGVEAQIIEQLKMVQLSTFDYCLNKCDFLCEYVNELFKAQRKLIKIELYPNPRHEENGLMDYLHQVCQQCAETLEEVNIEGFVEEPFSFAFMANCSKLEKCRLYLQVDIGISDIEYVPRQIKTFNLSQLGLSADQIYFIAEELLSLETLILSQNDFFPKVDLSMFKKLVRMPKLTKLIFDKKFSEYESILGWIIDHGQECVKAHVETVYFGTHRYHTRINVTIDRSMQL